MSNRSRIQPARLPIDPIRTAQLRLQGIAEAGDRIAAWEAVDVMAPNRAVALVRLRSAGWWCVAAFHDEDHWRFMWPNRAYALISYQTKQDELLAA